MRTCDTSGAGRLPRFFVQPDAPARPSSWTEGDEIILSPAESHHAAHVLRLKAGSAAEIFDGLGTSAEARVVRVGRREVVLTVAQVRSAAGRPEPLVALASASPKGSRLDWLLEKATELGVARLTPVVFERSVASREKLSQTRRRRWLARCVAAAKQARLDFLPVIDEPMSVAEYAASRLQGICIYGDTSPRAVRLPDAVRSAAGDSRASSSPPERWFNVVVGPEGGLTEAERHTLDVAGFTPVRLGHTTLRVETAAIALVAAAVALGE